MARLMKYCCLALVGIFQAVATDSIDNCDYPDEAAARAVWKPSWDSAPAEVVELAGSHVLRLPCRFAGTTAARASWDRGGAIDLTTCRGIEFEIQCPYTAPIAHFSLYFQSGKGWYSASFHPDSREGWSSVRLDKSGFRTEGTPAGWGEISAIRLSAWRGGETDSELLIRNFRKTDELGVDALVAIARADSLGAEDSKRYADDMAEMLRAADVGCSVISDRDLTPERLRKAAVVILPYNPRLSETAEDAVRTYAENGGKLMVFYTVPRGLRPILGVKTGRHMKEPRPGYFSAIRFEDGALPGAPTQAGQHSWNINAIEPEPGRSRTFAEWLDDEGRPTGHAAIVGSDKALVMTHVALPDDPFNKRRMLLAMTGYLAPEVWRRAVQAAMNRIGGIGGCASFEEAAAKVAGKRPAKAEALAALNSALSLRSEAGKLLAQGDHPAALNKALSARGRMMEAWCRAQRSEPGEFRAFWCHSAFGVRGMDWDEAIRRLAEGGFNAIMPNLLWGGAAYYPSEVLPVAAEVAERGDQMTRCIAACRKHGVQIHVWKVDWNLGRTVPKEFLARLGREKRLQRNVAGEEQPWLCPSHPANRDLEIAAMLEVARKYDVDGLHFDYIRYPGGDVCFCDGCRERFQQSIGTEVHNWPKDALADGALRQPWLDWRRRNIDAVVEAVSRQAREIRPGIKISAAVFRNWSTDRDTVGQDWKLWCDKGWLDFVCPMDYTPSSLQFENMVARQVEWAGRVPVYPGIGASASRSRLEADGVIEQIEIARGHKTGGFVIFNYGEREAKELAPLLGLGVTAPSR